MTFDTERIGCALYREIMFHESRASNSSVLRCCTLRGGDGDGRGRGREKEGVRCLSKIDNKANVRARET